MDLNSEQAFRLVQLVALARDDDAFHEAAQTALSFLVEQLHRLGDQANGYPRGPINAGVWHEGRLLTQACDQFADACQGRPAGEEQASRLAATMALQVMAHYPHEIFPRVLRNARCCEAMGKASEALAGYRSITGDFAAMALHSLCTQPEALEDWDWTILRSAGDAFAGVQRLSPGGATADELALQQQVAAALQRQP